MIWSDDEEVVIVSRKVGMFVDASVSSSSSASSSSATLLRVLIRLRVAGWLAGLLYVI